MTDEIEQIEDAAELAQVRRQARSVHVRAVLAAIPLTIGALILPQGPWRKAHRPLRRRSR
jgi:hypothetical protein